jgi:hypothetical protein
MDSYPRYRYQFWITHLHMLNHVGVDGTLEAVVLGAVFLSSAAGDSHWTPRRASFAMRGRLDELFLDRLVGSWQENDLAVCGFGHGLHGFEVSK